MIHPLLLMPLMFFLSPSADACTVCTASGLSLAFPFIWKATWILAAWRVLYLVFQWKRNSGLVFLSLVIQGLALLFFCLLFFHNAGFFIYFFGSFIRAVIRAVSQLKEDTAHGGVRSLFLLHGLTVCLLTPTIVHSYIVFSHQDALDRLRYYVYTGTYPVRQLVKEIEGDGLDYGRIREMIASPKRSESQMAFEILYTRKISDDLLALEETILGIPESEYRQETSTWRRTG